MKEYVSSRFNNFSLDKIIDDENKLDIYLHNDCDSAICPICGAISNSYHSFKPRKAYDIGYNGKPVTIFFETKRYRCLNKNCDVKTFNERLQFIESNRNITNYVVIEIINMSDKPVREISKTLDEKYNVKISKTTVSEVINTFKNNPKFESQILKKDKEALEKAIDEAIDMILKVPYNNADYILELVDSKYDLINKIIADFSEMSNYNTTYPCSLFILAGIMAKMKRMIAVHHMPFALTSSTAINKVGYNISKLRPDNSYFSEGAFRDYLLCAEPENMIKCFNKLNEDLNKDIKPTTHIVDATKICVNYYNGNYENAGCISDLKGNKRKGYKLSTLYGYIDNQLILENSYVTPLNVSDINVFKDNIVPNTNVLKKGDYILLDRGYTSFEMFNDLLSKGIYIITPAKKNSNLMKDAIYYIKKEQEGIRNSERKEYNFTNDIIEWKDHPNKKRTNQQYTTIHGLRVYENESITKKTKSYEVSCAVIRFLKNTNEDILDDDSEDEGHYYEDDKYCYALIYSTDPTLEGNEIIGEYEKRMKIEDQYKNMKENFELCRLTSTKYKFIVFQILTTINSLSLIQLFTMLPQGKNYKNKHLKTIINKLDPLNLYSKTDYIISRNGVFETYKDIELFKLFCEKGPEFQKMFISRYEEIIKSLQENPDN